MEHLNRDEIVSFVNIKEYGAESAKLVKKVNYHIMSCPECALRVRRAAREAELLEAVSREDFSMRDALVSAYGIPAEAVRAEAANVFEDDGAFRY